MNPLRFGRIHLRVPFLVLAALEFLVCFVAVFAAASLRFDGKSLLEISSVEWPIPTALSFGIVIPLAVMAMGLYHARFRGPFRSVVWRILAGFGCGGAVLATLYYLVPSLYLGRGVLLPALAIAFLPMLALRLLFFTYCIERDMLRRRVVVLGAGERAATIERRMRRRSDRRGFQVIGYVPLCHNAPSAAIDPELLIERGNRPIADLCTGLGVQEIITAAERSDDELPLDQLLDARFAGMHVIDIAAFHEREQGKLPLELLSSGSLVYADGFDNGRIQDFVKRQFDVIASLLVLAVAWPLMLLATLAIRLEDGPRAPVFYRQTRIGHCGRPFEVLKFRSMRVDAEAAGVALWATAGDRRVTRVGRLMRKTRIDELPQLLNVLRGDMSIVGPRPERPQFVAELDTLIPHYGKRHIVKPGITGWAQIGYPYGASVDDAKRKQELDLFYIKNHSLMLDTMILLLTAEVVLFKHVYAR